MQFSTVIEQFAYCLTSYWLTFLYVPWALGCGKRTNLK